MQACQEEHAGLMESTVNATLPPHKRWWSPNASADPLAVSCMWERKGGGSREDGGRKGEAGVIENMAN